VLLRTRVITAAFAALVVAGAWAPPAGAAFVSKRDARAYLLHAVPRGAARVMLRDERAAFFHAERVWVQRAERCRRRSAVAVSCRVVVRLVPDEAHRKQNWWPISCRGSVLVRRMADGRLKGTQRNYVCRTTRH
jgi:hypothetical protein